MPDFKKYPLVEKLLAEPVPVNLMMQAPHKHDTEFLARCAEIIETAVEGPATDKETLLAGCVFMSMNMPSLFKLLDRRGANLQERIKKEYSPQLAALLDAFMGDDQTVRDNNVDFVQVSHVVMIVRGEEITERLKEGAFLAGFKPEQKRQVLGLMKQTIAERQASGPPQLLLETAPKLQALMEKTDRAVLDAILKHGPSAESTQILRPPKP